VHYESRNVKYVRVEGVWWAHLDVAGEIIAVNTSRRAARLRLIGGHIQNVVLRKDRER